MVSYRERRHIIPFYILLSVVSRTYVLGSNTWRCKVFLVLVCPGKGMCDGTEQYGPAEMTYTGSRCTWLDQIAFAPVHDFATSLLLLFVRCPFCMHACPPRRCEFYLLYPANFAYCGRRPLRLAPVLTTNKALLFFVALPSSVRACVSVFVLSAGGVLSAPAVHRGRTWRVRAPRSPGGVLAGAVRVGPAPRPQDALVPQVLLHWQCGLGKWYAQQGEACVYSFLVFVFLFVLLRRRLGVCTWLRFLFCCGDD